MINKRNGATLSASKCFAITEIKYTAKDKVSICVIKADMDADIKMLLRMAHKFHSDSELQFKGIAFCHPNDTFNEMKGKDISEHRAMKKYYQFIKQCFRDIETYFGNAKDTATEFKAWADAKISRQSELIETISMQ